MVYVLQKAKSVIKAIARRLAGPARRMPYVRLLVHQFVARFPRLARPLIRLATESSVSPFAWVLDLEHQSTRTRAVHNQLAERLGKRAR